jgi:para-nitrobenzyl esterase
MPGSGRRWSLTRIALGLITAGALIAGAPAAGASPAAARPAGGRLVVPTADGALRGKAVGSSVAGAMDEFLGIPYAAPPVGRLRWRPPHPARPWSGIRSATSFAPHCPQPASPFGVASTSENCLYLNVYRPAHSWGRRLPVLVWIHGGSLLVGESDDYNPAALVRHGIIVVSINYRLGALGFLADAALARRPGGPSGNYGLMDQQAALRWVQRNIGAFGGDRHDVTIAGESAGGLSVLSQLVSPRARGLFARAIVESGTYALTQASLATAESAGASFATKVGCTSHVASCLRHLPVTTIIDNENAGGYQPNLDGRVLPQSIGAALKSGQFHRVPVIIGTNHDEWRLFVGLDQLEGTPPVTAANYQSMISSTLGVPAAAAAVIAAKYPLSAYSSPAVALGAVGTDAIFACPAVSAELSLSQYVPTYAYEFNDENAPMRFLPNVGFPYGAYHAAELQYLFTLSSTPLPGTFTPAQQELAAAMQRDWTTFARFGAPSFGAAWPRFTPTGLQALSLVPPRPQVETDFVTEHQCAFWASLAG